MSQKKLTTEELMQISDEVFAFATKKFKDVKAGDELSISFIASIETEENFSQKEFMIGSTGSLYSQLLSLAGSNPIFIKEIVMAAQAITEEMVDEFEEQLIKKGAIQLHTTTPAQA